MVRGWRQSTGPGRSTPAVHASPGAGRAPLRRSVGDADSRQELARWNRPQLLGPTPGPEVFSAASSVLAPCRPALRVASVRFKDSRADLLGFSGDSITPVVKKCGR